MPYNPTKRAMIYHIKKELQFDHYEEILKTKQERKKKKTLLIKCLDDLIMKILFK
jgi:hypothetical protein